MAPDPTNTYHPRAVQALVTLKDKLQALIADVDAAIVSAPPPYVAPAPASTTILHGTTNWDSVDVYASPADNAQVVGKLTRGAVLPVTLDAAQSPSGTKWYKITSGEFVGKFVQSVSLVMQNS